MGQPLELPGAGARTTVSSPTTRSRELIGRGAVIGAAFDAWMLVPGWVRGTSTPERDGVTLETVADHIDHICQLAGNARHCGIGSDLDGAFGREQCPSDVETIADLARLPAILARRGYSSADVESIAHGNFIRVPAGGVEGVAASCQLPASSCQLESHSRASREHERNSNDNSSLEGSFQACLIV